MLRSDLFVLLISTFVVPTATFCSDCLLRAQETAIASPPDQAGSTDSTWEKIVQPETDDPNALVAFLQNIKNRKPRTPEQYIEMQSAIRTAAKKALELPDRISPAALKIAESEYIASSVLLLSQDGEDAKAKTYQKFFEYLSERNPINDYDQQLVVLLGQNAELSGNAEEAIQVYSKIIDILESKKDAKIAGFISFIQSAVKRLKLIDNKIDLKSVSIDGKAFDVESVRGSFALICFWATFSPPSVSELKRLRDIHDRYAPSDLRIVSIAMDEQSEKVRQQIETMSLPWTQLWDQASIEQLPVSFQLGISAVPSMILLDREGTVIALLTSTAAAREALEKIFKAEKK